MSVNTSSTLKSEERCFAKNTHAKTAIPVYFNTGVSPKLNLNAKYVLVNSALD
ncbi:MAG: hypothetical protein RL368_1766 [Pseudomonadota bacterium]